jgi:uncharacterized protein (TIGR02996 family)
MHPEADAFLDAIFDHPDDDTPRLVYADWLQEHGQENYAQFIRLQCAAAREKLWSDEANRLWEEIGRVWPRLDEEWWPATRDDWLAPCSLDAIHFHRGLLRPGLLFTADQAILYSVCWPSIMTHDASLTIDSPPDELLELATNPVLCHVRHIRFVSDWYGGEPLPVFLRSPYLRRTRSLDLRGLYLNPAAIEALLNAENLSRVEDIQLSAKEEDVMARLRKRFKRVNDE